MAAAFGSHVAGDTPTGVSFGCGGLLYPAHKEERVHREGCSNHIGSGELWKLS